MQWSWKLGRVAGIDLFLHPTFFLLLGFVGATHANGLLAMGLIAAVFGCVLLHELGHALMARRFGIETLDITLYPIGGVARLERMPKAPGAELLIALAGPAVNIVLAGGFLLAQVFLLPPPSVGWGMPALFVSALVTINIGLAVFNMIPAFPMDGGRVLRAFLSGWLGRLRATEIAAELGQALAILFAIYCVFQGAFLQALLAGFIYLAARGELRQVKSEEYRRRREQALRDQGIWIAPAGYRWINCGPGVWQLAPIVATTSQGQAPWR